MHCKFLFINFFLIICNYITSDKVERNHQDLNPEIYSNLCELLGIIIHLDIKKKFISHDLN